MRKRLLGSTELRVTELALGTWGLSGEGYGAVTEEEQDGVIERALALGIRLFDVADCYGKGGMLTRLGKSLEEFVPDPEIPDDDARVVVRIGTDRTGRPAKKRFDVEFLRSSVKNGCERLKRSKLDIVLLHNPSLKCVDKRRATECLQELKAEGLVSAWGISSGSEAVSRAALNAGAEVLEVAYNALHTRELHAISEEVAAKNVGILARSVLGHGLLGGYWSSSRKFPYGDHRQHRWSADQLRERLRQASALRAAFAGDVGTQRAIAVRFALDNSHVSAVVLGPRSAVQIDQLVREAGQRPPYLSPEQHTRLSTRLSDLGVAF